MCVHEASHFCASMCVIPALHAHQCVCSGVCPAALQCRAEPIWPLAAVGPARQAAGRAPAAAVRRATAPLPEAVCVCVCVCVCV